MAYTLLQHLNYNVWANGKIADFIAMRPNFFITPIA